MIQCTKDKIYLFVNYFLDLDLDLDLDIDLDLELTQSFLYVRNMTKASSINKIIGLMNLPRSE